MKLYRLLLHAYPASFRSDYGDEMSSVFARRLRVIRNPALAMLFWLETVFEVLYNAALVHADILRQDLRYTARTLGRSRGFTLTAILVAAIGIGASTAAFTMVDHVLIRPFPFADQERLIMIYEDHSYGSGRRGLYFDVAPGNYRDWKRLSTSFEGMAMYRRTSVNLITDKDPEQIAGGAVTYDMFPLLGAKPALGRAFTAEDDSDAAPGALLLSYGLWQGMFGGDAGILGRKAKVDNTPFTIIGVMPKNFYFPSRNAQLWTPMRFGPQNYEDRADTWVYVIARLKHGVSMQTAQTEISTIAGQLQRAYPKELAHVGVSMLGLRDDGISGQARLMLMALLGAALCVLLIACTNIANLLIARSMVRRRELAVRAAMGAGRERLVRQMLTESVILALLGGSLGVLMARSALPLLVRLVPVTLPIAETPAMDLRVLLFAFLITCATGIGFGVIPALRTVRGEDSSSLRESARSGGGRRDKLRSALVVTEVAGSVVLLVGCGLLIRAMWRVQAVNPGFRADNILTLRTSLPMPKYEKNAAREQYQRVLAGARQLPGVQDAAYISFLPMVMGGGVWPVEVKGKPQELTARQLASLRFVTPGFFSIMSIPLLMGRDVSEADTRQAPFVALVSESFVRKYWPGENPIGRHFDFGNYDRVVVGVVGDVRVRGLERSEPQVYLPYKQHDKVSTGYAPKDLVVRASENTQALAPALRRIIREADPEQPISDVRMLSDIVQAETAPRKVQVIVLGTFAASAFLLAAIGIHGLLAFAVSTRTREIGVRMALGAQGRDIVAMVLRDGLLLATAGIVIGVALAYGAGVKLQGLLAGVRPSDPLTFLSAAGLCVLMTLLGSLAPALRAVRVGSEHGHPHRVRSSKRRRICLPKGVPTDRYESTLVVSLDPAKGDFQSLQPAIDALPASGGKIFVKAGVYAIASTIQIKASNVHIQGEGMGITVFVADSGMTGNTPALEAFSTAPAGAKRALVADTARGDLTIRTSPADASSFAADDFVLLYSDKQVDTESPAKHAGELKQIAAADAATGVIQLDDQIFDAYLQADAAQVVRITMLRNITLSDFSITTQAPSSTLKVGFTHFRFIENLQIERLEVHHAYHSGIQVQSVRNSAIAGCYLHHIRDTEPVNPPNPSNERYGIAVGGASHNVSISGCRFSHTRHAVTTGASSGTNQNGMQRNIVVANCTSMLSDTGHFDTHQPCENVTFIGCVADGGVPAAGSDGAYGFQMRGRNCSIVGCSVLQAVGRGIMIFGPASSGAVISGNMIANVKAIAGNKAGSGIYFDSAGSSNHAVTGNVIKNCEGPGITNGANNNDLVITGNVIENVNSAVPGAAIELIDAARVLISGNNIGADPAGPAIAMLGNSDEWRIIGNRLNGSSEITLTGAGSVVLNNLGYNPVGNIVNPWPTTSADLTNTVVPGKAEPDSDTPYTVRHTPKTIVVRGGDVSQILINDADTGATAGGAYKLGVGETIKFVYNTTAPATAVFAE